MIPSGHKRISPFKKDRLHHASQSVESVSQKLKNRPKPPPRAGQGAK